MDIRLSCRITKVTTLLSCRMTKEGSKCFRITKDGGRIRHYFYLTLNKPLKVDISLFSPAIICLFPGITGAVSHYHRADTQIGYSSSSLIIISKRDYWLSKKFKLKTNLLWFLQARRLATVLKYSSYANML